MKEARRLLQHHIAGGAHGVEAGRHDVEHDVGLREALLRDVSFVFGDDRRHQLGAVFSVEDGEGVGVADGLGMTTEQGVASVVKRAAHDGLCFAAA